MMRSLWTGFRGSRANAALIIGTIATGMAAVTLVYAILDAVLLRPLPYAGASRLSVVWTLGDKKAQILSSPARLRDMARDAKRWESISGFYSENMNLVSVNGNRLSAPERLYAVRTLPGFARSIGLQPRLGRAPEGNEENFGGPKTLVVSDSFWRSYMNANPSAVGQTITLNSDTYTVAGVAPVGFRFPDARTMVYVPGQLHPNLLQARGARFLVGLGLRREGVSAGEGAAELEALARGYGKKYGVEEASYGMGVEDPRSYLVGRGTERSIWLLSGAVLLLLGIATVNAANLMLARGVARQRDHAVRIAIGADRSRILREVVGEGMALSVMGGALGAFLSWWALEIVLRYWKSLPTFRDPQLDWRVMAITLLIAGCAGILCSIAPALASARQDALETLRTGARGVGSVGGARWRHALIGGEVALCFVLLAGSIALSQSLSKLEAVPLGFARTELLSFGVAIPWETSPGQRMSFFRQLRNKLAESPLVKNVVYADWRPLDAPMRFGVRTEANLRVNVPSVNVSEGYFEALGIPLIRGRAFGPQDLAGRERVAVLSQSAARLLFGDEDPIGKRFFQQWDREERPRTVIGVVGDTTVDAKQGPTAMKYETSQDDQWPSPVFFVETRGDRAVALAELRNRLREFNPARAIHGVESLQTYVDGKRAEPRLNFILVSLFGGAAALLAFLGLFGVLSWYVAQRKGEIGVRAALGATPSHIAALILRQGLAPSLWGGAAGVAMGVWALRAAERSLYQADPRLACAYAAAAILALALLALALPAWRASRINPLQALRED
jgi:predicted permease